MKILKIKVLFTLCLDAAGSNEPSDMLNPYYWTQAAPTVVESTIVPIAAIRNMAKGLQLLNRIGTPLIEEGKFLIRTSIRINNFESLNDFIDTQMRNHVYSDFIDGVYSFFGIEVPN
jgi:hypothetical protein